MKNLTLLTALFLVGSLTAFTQSNLYKSPNSRSTKENAEPKRIENAKLTLPSEPRFYVNIHAGYSLATGSTFKYYPDDIRSIVVDKVGNNAATKTTKYSAPGKGLGEGFRFGVGLSYVVNDYINVGLDFDYSKTAISKVRDSSYRHAFAISGATAENSYNERVTISYHAELVTFTPSITIKAISRPKWLVYSKVGAILNLRPFSIQKETSDAQFRFRRQDIIRDSSIFTSKRYYWSVKNPSLGFMSGLGVQLKLSERIRAFGELQFSHIVFVARSRVFTNFTVNDVDLVTTLPVSERRTNYTSTISVQSNVDPDSPALAITERIPITYVGSQFGIGYRF